MKIAEGFVYFGGKAGRGFDHLYLLVRPSFFWSIPPENIFSRYKRDRKGTKLPIEPTEQRPNLS
jgi:hypothetical protein